LPGLNLKNEQPEFLRVIQEINKPALNLIIKQTMKSENLKKRKRVVKSKTHKIDRNFQNFKSKIVNKIIFK